MQGTAQMSALHEFDIRSRGVKGLLDEWESRHAEARRVWKIEDVVSAFMPIARAASDLQEQLKASGSADAPDAIDLPYFTHVLRMLLDASYRVEDRVCIHEGVGYVVQGADALRSGIRELEGILAEYDAKCESEDREWQELEKQALSSEDFKNLAAYLNETGKASA